MQIQAASGNPVLFFEIVHLSSDAGRIVISLLTGPSIVVKPFPLYSVTFSPGLGFLYSTSIVLRKILISLRIII